LHGKLIFTVASWKYYY